MYSIVKSILFLFSPELAHHIATVLLQIFCKLPFGANYLRKKYVISHQSLQKRVFDLQFANPVGLAAGFDKNAKYYNELANLGFGFIEIGTVTPKPQPGNPRPRLFRLQKDKALVNRMGFNNEGVIRVAKRIRKNQPTIVLGANIGKNKGTDNSDAISDYKECLLQLFEIVDYFVVNVSSPNTPNLRSLQEKKPLIQLLTTLQTLNEKQTKPKPILVKISPDLSHGAILDIIEIVNQSNIAGIVATNTTISREELTTSVKRIEEIGAGGLSGAPLKSRATEVIKLLRSHLPNAIIIGVGGIGDSADVKEKLEAGADLVQIYTSFIYEGPSIVRRINQGLINS